MPNDPRIELSTAGVVAVLAVLAYASTVTSVGTVAFWYVGPYLVANQWLIAYTWLHHTHVDMPHFGPDEFSFLRGAISTIDRPRAYGPLINHLHHHIGATHVAHHVCSAVPHYRAEALRDALIPVLGQRYCVDDTPIWKALYLVARDCRYMEGLSGTQFWKTMRENKAS